MKINVTSRLSDTKQGILKEKESEESTLRSRSSLPKTRRLKEEFARNNESKSQRSCVLPPPTGNPGDRSYRNNTMFFADNGTYECCCRCSCSINEKDIVATRESTEQFELVVVVVVVMVIVDELFQERPLSLHRVLGLFIVSAILHSAPRLPMSDFAAWTRRPHRRPLEHVGDSV